MLASANGIGAAPGVGLAIIGTIALATGQAGPDQPTTQIFVGASEADVIAEADGTAAAPGGGASRGAPQFDQADAIGAALWSQTVTASGTSTAAAIGNGVALAEADGTATASAVGVTGVPAEADGTATAPGISLPLTAGAGLAAGITTAPAVGVGGVVATANGLGAAPGIGVQPHGVASAAGLGAAPAIGNGPGAGAGLATGLGTASAFAFRSRKVGWFDEWPKPRRYYDAEELARILGERKRDPIKEAMEERERERVAKRASSRTRFAIAYRDAWVKVRANKGPLSNNLREFMHFLAPYKDSDEVDFEPLIEALQMALETNSAREIAQIMRRVERVMPLVERAYA